MVPAIITVERNGRTFKRYDRVKVWFDGAVRTGTIVSFNYGRFDHPVSSDCTIFEVMQGEWVIYDEKDYRTYCIDLHYVIILIRTDEKVGNDNDIYSGYGLANHPDGNIIFENEPSELIIPKPVVESDWDDEDLPF